MLNDPQFLEWAKANNYDINAPMTTEDADAIYSKYQSTLPSKPESVNQKATYENSDKPITFKEFLALSDLIRQAHQDGSHLAGKHEAFVKWLEVNIVGGLIARTRSEFEELYTQFIGGK